MSEVTTTTGSFTKYEGDNLSLRELKINDAIDAIVKADEGVTKAQAKLADAVSKLEVLRTEQQNAARYDALGVGDTITFTYGRGETKRVETGKIKAVGHDEKLGVLFAVEIGEGLDASIVKIQRIAVLFDYVAPAEGEVA